MRRRVGHAHLARRVPPAKSLRKARGPHGGGRLGAPPRDLTARDQVRHQVREALDEDLAYRDSDERHDRELRPHRDDTSAHHDARSSTTLNLSCCHICCPSGCIAGRRRRRGKYRPLPFGTPEGRAWSTAIDFLAVIIVGLADQAEPTEWKAVAQHGRAPNMLRRQRQPQ